MFPHPKSTLRLFACRRFGMSASAWNPYWGTIPAKERRNLSTLAHFCHGHAAVLQDIQVLHTVCQFLLPRINFPEALANREELLAHIGLGPDANVDEIQCDPLIASYGTCPSTMWGEGDPASACSKWPHDLACARLLAKIVTKVAADA